MILSSQFNMAWSDWIQFDQQGVDQVNQVGGVYEFANDTELLYIGKSDKLNRRLNEHLSENDSCINRATHFRIMTSDDPLGTEGTLLDDYRKGNGGNTPPCNG